MSPHYKQKKIDAMAIKIIYDVLNQAFGTNENAICGHTRKSKDVIARAMIARMLRDTFQVSYDTIGDLLGGRNKTNALRLCQLHDRYYALNYHGYRWDFIEIVEEFKGRYYNETSGSTEEGEGKGVQSCGRDSGEGSVCVPSEDQDERRVNNHGTGRSGHGRYISVCRPTSSSFRQELNINLEI
jgi:hypothetical protein